MRGEITMPIKTMDTPVTSHGYVRARAVRTRESSSLSTSQAQDAMSLTVMAVLVNPPPELTDP